MAGIFRSINTYRCLLLILERYKEDSSLWWRLTQHILTKTGFENLFHYDHHIVLKTKEDIREAVGTEYILIDFSSHYSIDDIFKQFPAGIPYDENDLLLPNSPSTNKL